MRSIYASAMLCALPFLTLPDPFASQRRGSNVTTSVRDGQGVTTCDQVEVRFEDAQTYRAEEQRTFPRASVATLSVQASRNGGIYVQGWDRDEYGVTLCKAAAAWADGGTLNDITLSATNGRITVNGPQRDGWIAYLLISTPRNGSLDLRADNGPIGVRDADGSIDAHTSNGPIDVKNCSGTLALEARNGPINITGGSGSLRARTENGPIGVRLTGSSWTGAGLDARANNGPLSLQVPDGYQSGVEVDLSAHSPFNCRGPVCSQASRDWDNRARTLRFGGSPTMVRLGTLNGPVSIETR